MNLLLGDVNAWWSGSGKETVSCTYPANSYYYGNKNDYVSAGNNAMWENTWRITNDRITFASGGSLNNIRCVRDVKVD